MKLLHTGDWHLGQTFFEDDCKFDQSRFLEWLGEQSRIQEADVSLVAGDVFDGPNPSADSQRMGFRFLREVPSESQDRQIVIIEGNHDVAAYSKRR